jgi:hypothetical protein
MKQINPMAMWVNGKNVNAIFINLYSINDNLSNSATFYYALLSAENETLAAGNLTISGEEYEIWGANENVNLAAFAWACTKLNLTLA